MSAQDDYKEAAMDSVDHQWVEVPCQRNVSEGQFPQGVQDYQFSISRPQGFVPAHSYFRVQMELVGSGDPAAASQPLLREQIAFAENAVGNLWTNVFMRAGGQDVSSLTSFAPQASMIQARTGKTRAWLNSVGKTWGMSGSFAERCAVVSQSAAGLAANAAPSGLSGFDDRRETTYKPCAAGQFLAATVAVAAAGDALTGVATAFTADDVGNTIFINGIRFTVKAFNSATSLALSVPIGAAQIVASTNWYMVKRNLQRSAEARNQVFCLWRPPIGIFDAEDVVLGSGDYRISLTPDSNFQSTGVETINDVPVPGVLGVATSTFTLKILNVTFYAATVKMSIPDSVQELHLKEYMVQQRVMNSSNINLSFSVPASTTCLHVMLQDNLAGNSARIPPSNFKVLNGSDLNISALQITYDNTTLPQTRWLSGFTPNPTPGRNTALLQQFYNQGLIARRAESSPGGAESFNEWLDRGPVYSFYFARDAASRSTDVQLQVSYDGAGLVGGFDTTSKLFLIAEYDRSVQVTTSNGLITEVRSLNV